MFKASLQKSILLSAVVFLAGATGSLAANTNVNTQGAAANPTELIELAQSTQKTAQERAEERRKAREKRRKEREKRRKNRRTPRFGSFS